jgi:PTH1 family peptidyl-tRNA hydrolase
METKKSPINAIIGLGNPGSQYAHNRHNIGFRILDALADRYGAQWQTKSNAELATITIRGHNLTLIKPQTFMNNSGEVVPALLKKGIKAENILVVHDELELPLTAIKFKEGGSHKGHNGLRSIITACGANFYRLRFGIGRPSERDDVPAYVLQNFKPQDSIDSLIDDAVGMIEDLF